MPEESKEVDILPRLRGILMSSDFSNQFEEFAEDNIEPFVRVLGKEMILWVLDNAGTVIQLQDAVGAAFPSLVSSLESRAVDWQTAIVTTDMLDPDHRGRLIPLGGDGSPFLSAGQVDAPARFAQGVRVGAEGSVVERGLESAWAALSPPLLHRDNEGLLRPGARLAVVIVGDDDDCSHEGRLVADTPEGCVANPDQLVPVSDPGPGDIRQERCGHAKDAGAQRLAQLRTSSAERTAPRPS